MAKEGKRKRLKESKFPNVVVCRFKNDNLHYLERLEKMLDKSNMGKNEYLETVIINHVKSNKALCKEVSVKRVNV